MNNIISKYKGILPISLFALLSQGVMAQESADTRADSINVAFRKSDVRDVIVPVSKVNVSELMEKNYNTYSLDNMQALTAGYNGQLWNQGEALVLIDGVPRDANNVLPTEIEDITFLKGASAVVLYGSRASKGVILITTKRGSIAPLKISARANYTMDVAKSFPTYLDGAEYMTLYNQALANDGLSPKFTDEQIYNTAAGTNPYRYPNQQFYTSDYLNKTKSRYDVTAEFQGGGKFAQFYTNVSYYRQGDFINFGEGKNNYTDRLNVRGNIDLQLSDWASGWVNANATYYNQHGSNSNFWSAASTLRPNRVAPFIPVSFIDPLDVNSLNLIQNTRNIIHNPAGLPAGDYFLGATQEDQSNAFADMYSAGYNTWTSRQFQFDAGVKFDLKSILKGLSFKTNFAVDYKTSYSTSLNDQYATFGVNWTQMDGYDVIGSLTQYGQDKHTGTLNASNSAEQQTIAWNGQFDYVNSWGDHNLHATLVANGYQQTISGEYHRVSNANLGLQASYNFAHKYYVDLAANAVHSAKLPEGNRKAISPSVTLGWRLTSEDFMKDMDWLDDLRLTAGYTVLNQDLDIAEYFMYKDIFTATGTWWGWSDANNSIQTSDSQRGGNDELSFVKRKEFNVGLNGALLKNKLTFSVNYFNTTVDGLLAQPDYIYPSYMHTYWPVSTFVPYINYGKNRRQGIDFAIAYNDKAGDFEWGVQAFGQTTTSKNLRVAENVEFEYQRSEGKATDAIWGLECLGYYNSQEEIDNAEAKSSFGTVKPGDLKYKDQNGDGIIDSKDQVVLGRWGAKFSGGLNLTLKYRNFTLFAMLTGQFGGNAIKNDTYNWVYGERKYSDVVRGAWTEEKFKNGEMISYPRLTTQSPDNNFRTSDYWMYKTDRLDLARVQITYDFSKSLFGPKSIVKGLQIYANGNSLLTIAGERDQMERNVGSSPQTRSFTLGAKVEF
ncbi:MAG: SusC/RagA family TonB-linked outer membrane protein [Prevotella sp.]|nr:SusC/RagA family TonB-linked outer membrane protein [Bacteroidales bacterium]MDY5877948.1 SusC/RagA family TonB-linked outer membrane protein [Prevotella sp.]